MRRQPSPAFKFMLLQGIITQDITVKNVILQCLTNDSLNTIYIQAKNENVRYNCVHCDYKETAKGSLKIHTQTKHEQLKFQCSQCSHKATRKQNLRLHKQAKHEHLKFQCSQC